MHVHFPFIGEATYHRKMAANDSSNEEGRTIQFLFPIIIALDLEENTLLLPITIQMINKYKVH